MFFKNKVRQCIIKSQAVGVLRGGWGWLARGSLGACRALSGEVGSLPHGTISVFQGFQHPGPGTGTMPCLLLLTMGPTAVVQTCSAS